MLDGLDQIPWASLHHAYGPATDAPELLRALASGDAQIRGRAFSALYGNLWHQGTVYEATAYAVPFLIELAGAPQIADRHEILAYLGHIACGSSYLDVHQHMSLFAEERQTPDFAERLRQELDWVASAFEAVRSGGTVYAGLLADGSPLVRAGAAHLLSLFPQDADRNIGWLCAHTDSGEDNDTVHVACVLAVGRLAAGQANAIARLKRLFTDDSRRAVRLAAALGLADALRSEAPDDALTLLAEALHAPGAEAEVFHELPWEGSDLEGLCARAMAQAGPAALKALPAMAEAMERGTAWRSYGVAAMMLHLAFEGRPAPEGATFVQLTEAQQEAVRAISASGKFWTGFDRNVICANACHVLRSFGLPDMPDALCAYVAGST